MKTSPVTTTQQGDRRLHEQRTVLTDRLHTMSWEFVRDPSMEKVDEMEAVRNEITALERRIVKTKIFQAMMDLELESETSLGILDDDDREYDEYDEDSPHTY